MASMKLNVQVDSARTMHVLDAMQTRLRNPAPLLRSVGQALAENIRLGFTGSQDPWGAAWKALKPATIKARRGGGVGGVQALLDTGRLRNSIAVRPVGNTAVEVGTTVAYAAIHQWGGTVQYAARSIRVRLRTVTDDKGRKVSRFAKDSHKRARTVWGEAQAWQVNIPARPFMPMRPGGAVDLPAAWAAEVRRLAAAWVLPGGS